MCALRDSNLKSGRFDSDMGHNLNKIMKLESEKIEYNKEDEKNFSLTIKKRIKNIIADGYSFYGLSKEWPGKNIVAVRIIYQRALERKVLTEKNKNISDEEYDNEMHMNISRHCSEKKSEERRQEQIEKMVSKSLYSNNLFDELLSNRMFTGGIPAGHITLLMGNIND